MKNIKEAVIKYVINCKRNNVRVSEKEIKKVIKEAKNKLKCGCSSVG